LNETTRQRVEENGGKGIMNAQNIGSRTRTTAVLLAASLAVCAAGVTGCASGVAESEPQAPAVRHVRVAPVPAELRGSTPDRIDRALAARAAEQRALAERFAGVPADRIEEQLAREAKD
jgi:hypothetical protein